MTPTTASKIRTITSAEELEGWLEGVRLSGRAMDEEERKALATRRVEIERRG